MRCSHPAAYLHPPPPEEKKEGGRGGEVSAPMRQPRP